MLMKNSNLGNQCRYNLVDGILHRWAFYLVFICTSVVFCIWLNAEVKVLNNFQHLNLIPSTMDYLLKFFQGAEVYNPLENKPFTIPAIWLFLNLYLAFMIANYPTHDLQEFGKNIFVRSQTRTAWFVSKCIWNIVTVTIIYILLYLIILIFSIVNNNISMRVTPEIADRVLLISHFKQSSNLFLVAILLPPVTSYAISFLQMFLEFILKPIYSFVIVVCLLSASAYYYNYFLIGNHSMLLRNEVMLDGGIKTWIAVVIDVAIIAGSIIGGVICFKRYDVLGKS